MSRVSCVVSSFDDLGADTRSSRGGKEDGVGGLRQRMPRPLSVGSDVLTTPKLCGWYEGDIEYDGKILSVGVASLQCRGERTCRGVRSGVRGEGGGKPGIGFFVCLTLFQNMS